jgi:hypothetical protein
MMKNNCAIEREAGALPEMILCERKSAGWFPHDITSDRAEFDVNRDRFFTKARYVIRVPDHEGSAEQVAPPTQ